MSSVNKPAFVYVTYIATTPEKLWTALTDGEFTRRYWGGRRIRSDWIVGSPVEHVRETVALTGGGEGGGHSRLTCSPTRFTCRLAMTTAVKNHLKSPFSFNPSAP